MIIQLALQGALDDHFRQLPRQAALAGQLQPAGPGPLGKLTEQLLVSRRQLAAGLALIVRHVNHWCLLRLGSYTVEITVPNVTVPDGVEATARDGNLTLTGLVEYGSQREAAERAVAGLTGVRNVRDDIEISCDADPASVKWFVQDALDRNAVVEDDSDVHVDASGHTVTLGGHVRTWAEHDAVVSAAWMVGGVAPVRDDLDVTG
jgi:hypothetical protein